MYRKMSQYTAAKMYFSNDIRYTFCYLQKLCCQEKAALWSNFLSRKQLCFVVGSLCCMLWWINRPLEHDDDAGICYIHTYRVLKLPPFSTCCERPFSTSCRSFFLWATALRRIKGPFLIRSLTGINFLARTIFSPLDWRDSLHYRMEQKLATQWKMLCSWNESVPQSLSSKEVSWEPFATDHMLYI